MSSRRWALLACAALWACATTAHADCEVTSAPAPVHIGTLGVFEASGPEVSARFAERAAHVSIVCPKGAVYYLRARPARDGVLMGDIVSMVNTTGGQQMPMAVVLESFDGTRVQRRFSTLPQARYAAIGTGLPQLALLRLDLADAAGQKRMGRRDRAAAGFYKVQLKLEVELQ